MAEPLWKSWLKWAYSEAPVEEPDAKRARFSDIHEGLKTAFPSETISAQMVSAAIQGVFPNSQRVRLGKERLTYVMGIEALPTTLPEETCESVEVLKAQNDQLNIRVQQLERRVQELEEQAMHNTPLTSTASIGQQMDTLLKHEQCCTWSKLNNTVL